MENINRNKIFGEDGPAPSSSSILNEGGDDDDYDNSEQQLINSQNDLDQEM
jgi:hypothetical protein